MTPVWRWIAVVATAEAVGFSVAAAVAIGVTMTGLDGTAGFALTVAGGAAEGALLGTGQWLAMGGNRPPAARWILATSAGAAIAWSLGLLPSTMALAPSTPPAFVAIGLGALLLLASIPVAQWLVLRRPGMFRWVLVNMGAWAVAILWTLAPSPLIDEHSPTWLIAVLYVIAGALMAVTIAVLTARIGTRYFSGVDTDGGDRPLPLPLRYPTVFITLTVGLIGGALWVAGSGEPVRWVFGGFALLIGGIVSVRIVQQLRHRRFGIDILAVIAIVATVAVGEVIASMIIVLMVSGGKALEDFAQGRAQRELNALLSREPQTAHRLVPGSTEVEEIAASQVVIGDLLLVRSGEVVPVDGSLESASAAFDESSLTGESLPRTLLRGEAVLSGAVNGNISSTIVATATAENSQYQAIVGLVKQASANRAPVVRLADRYAIPFTAVSLLIAGAAWAISGDPVRFAEVLVLATPCPLVLAAPIAFMGGMSRAARNGIIVKGGAVLEQLSRVRTAVFDKTGTLTHGRPQIVKILAMPPFDETTLLTLAASAEQASSHVLAASIVAAARERGVPLSRVSQSAEVGAQGVTALVNRQSVAVGTLGFVTALAPEAAATPLVGGELAIYVAVGGRFAGSIIATDSVRSNAASTITDLRAHGIGRILMLTGDAQKTADHVADSVGITDVRADCLPVDKVEAVSSLSERPVMMVGDGVNDAPVLASADVGIAMGARGATAASEAAAAVILVDDVSRVTLAVEIGHDTVRIALQSIWLGIALSLGLMTIAAFGLIPATLGAGIQEIVDLATILNALRAVRAGSEIAMNPRPEGSR